MLDSNGIVLDSNYIVLDSNGIVLDSNDIVLDSNDIVHNDLLNFLCTFRGSLERFRKSEKLGLYGVLVSKKR